MVHRKDHILALRQDMVSPYVPVYGPFSVTTAFPTPPERPFPFAGANRPANPAAAIVSATHARTIFVGAPRIAKQVCFTLEVKPDFGGDGTAMASRAAARAAAEPKTLAARKAPPQKNAPSKKQVSGKSIILLTVRGFHRN